MKKKAQFYISLLFLVAILSSCKDEPIQPIDTLPPATNEGKNTFGCLIDGEAFIPNTKAGAYGVHASYNAVSRRFAWTLVEKTMMGYYIVQDSCFI